MDDMHLPPTKIKRQYKCSSCSHVTVNPREHLRHLKDVHNRKVKIVECPLCVYACQYRQKLNRHLKLVHNILQPHRNLSSIDDSQFQLQQMQQRNSLLTFQQQSQQTPTYSSFSNYIPYFNADISSYASQLVPFDTSDDEPVDLSFPQELKQLIKTLEGQKCQMPFDYLGNTSFSAQV